MKGKNVVCIKSTMVDIEGVDVGETVYLSSAVLERTLGSISEPYDFNFLFSKNMEDSMILSDIGYKIAAEYCNKNKRVISNLYMKDDTINTIPIVPTCISGSEFSYLNIDIVNKELVVTKVKHKHEATVLFFNEWKKFIKNLILFTEPGMILSYNVVNDTFVLYNKKEESYLSGGHGRYDIGEKVKMSPNIKLAHAFYTYSDAEYIRSIFSIALEIRACSNIWGVGYEKSEN